MEVGERGGLPTRTEIEARCFARPLRPVAVCPPLPWKIAEVTPAAGNDETHRISVHGIAVCETGKPTAVSGELEWPAFPTYAMALRTFLPFGKSCSGHSAPRAYPVGAWLVLLYRTKTEMTNAQHCLEPRFTDAE